MPRFPGGRTRAARRAGTACSGRTCAARPYSGSPTTGWPIASRCARIWCVRPVSSVTRSSVSSASARSVSKCVIAWCGSSVSVEIRVRTRRSRPSGASIVPRRAGGRPSTSATYSRVIRRSRNAACSAACTGSERASSEQARRVAVQPVHDARALGIGPARDAPRERLDERPVGVAVAGMHDDARGLVDHEQVLVLVGDPVRRRRDLGRGRLRAARRPRAPRPRPARGAWASGTPSTRTSPASISFCAFVRVPTTPARKTSSRSPAASAGTFTWPSPAPRSARSRRR